MNKGNNIILEIVNISKSFPGVQALKNINMEIKKAEIHAICGENGAGKSTLMQIISGVYKYDSGEILLNGEKVVIKNQKNANELGISMVYQDRSLVDGLSVEENIFSARQPVNFLDNIDWKKLYFMTQELLDGLKIPINPKAIVGRLSPAKQQMVEIAKALSLNPSILILDEPTSTITQKEILALFNIIRKLKSEGKSIIYISHRLTEVFKIADKISILKDGNYMGTEEVRNVNQEWAINKMIGRKVYFSLKERDVEDIKFFECRNFTNKNFKNISFYLKKGELLSFAGLTGAGRTELFKSVIGVLPKTSGELYLEGKKIRIRNPMEAIENGIVYLPENRKEEGLFLNLSVQLNIISASLKKFQKGFEVDNRKISEIAKKYVEELSIDTPSLNQQVVNLSGGNQQKVVLAKWLIINSKILIIDEPTRGIDVGVKIEIFKLLRRLCEEGKSIIMISSELPEVLSISDRIYVMCNGILTGEVLIKEANEEKIIKMASGIKEEEYN